MFTKKSHADIKKSTAKLQDCKKDSASRLRHLRTILGKYLFTYIYLLFKQNTKLVYFEISQPLSLLMILFRAIQVHFCLIIIIPMMSKWV